jgi:hypothetical protein
MPEVKLRKLRQFSSEGLPRIVGHVSKYGVYKRGSAAIIGQAVVGHGRRFWLFVSFAGMPLTTA